MRLDKLLIESKTNTISKKTLKHLLVNKKVVVNGKAEQVSNRNIDGWLDKLIVDGIEIDVPKHQYIMLNKRKRTITAHQSSNYPTVFTELGSECNKTNLSFVGRLDQDTEGLMLLTDNGQLNYNLAVVKKGISKEYYLEVQGQLTPKHIASFAQGIVLEDNTLCKPAQLICLTSSSEKSTGYISLTEGKYHQIKRMFKMIDCPVTYLKRLRIANLILDTQLKPGEYRHLTKFEIQKLSMYF